MMSRAARIVWVSSLVGVLLLIVASVALRLAEQRDQEAWHPVPCIVDRGAVVSNQNSWPGGRGFKGTGPSSGYSVVLSYRYKFDRLAYTGYTYSNTSFWCCRDSAEEALASIPLGVETTCYVDPVSPTQALLRIEPDHSAIWLLAALSVLPLFGLYLLAGAPGFKRRVEAPEPPSGSSRKRRSRR